jgi:integrase
MTLGAFVPQHLTLWRQEATVTETWLKETGARLQSGAIRFFGADRPLLSITSREVLRFKIWLKLKEYSNGRGGTLSGSTQRKYLEALSGLFTAAIRQRAYNGPNPVAGIVKPLEPPPSEEWFELWQTAALLEAARTYQPVAPGRPLPECGYALIAFIALTGCRLREAFGIEVEDVDFTRRVIRIHPNSWRRLKTPRPARVVPLWPQLAEILSEYLGEFGSRLNRLLFPSERLLACGREGLITDSRKMLDTLGRACRIPAGRGALEQAPPRLCDRATADARHATADARQRCTRVGVHGRARVAAYRRASRGADLWPLGRGASSLGGSGVPQRAVFGMAHPTAHLGGRNRTMTRARSMTAWPLRSRFIMGESSARFHARCHVDHRGNLAAGC